MQPIFKYYRVYDNETEVAEVSINDFRPIVFQRLQCGEGYFLSSVKQKFRDYINRAEAMEQAKKGALAYIHQMIADAEQAIERLIKYRNDHHDDLNYNLLEVNIRKFKKQMYIK